MPTVDMDTLRIDEILYEFVNREAMPGTGVEERPFWEGFAALVRNLAPRNAALLQRLQGVFSMYRDKAFYDAPAIPGYTWICYHYEEDRWQFNAVNPAAGDNLRKFLISFFNVCERNGH